MALIKCSECGTEISDKAAACVKCGAPIAAAKVVQAAPAKKKGMNIFQLFGIAIAATFAIVLFVGLTDDGKSKPAPSVAATKAASCAPTDLVCVGDANVVSASVYCKDPVERLAKHSVRWTDGTFELKFSRYRWTDKPGGHITFVGDKAEFQNGFGAYTPVTYFCEMAPGSTQVLNVEVIEGRLPS